MGSCPDTDIDPRFFRNLSLYLSSSLGSAGTARFDINFFCLNS